MTRKQKRELAKWKARRAFETLQCISDIAVSVAALSVISSQVPPHKTKKFAKGEIVTPSMANPFSLEAGEAILSPKQLKKLLKKKKIISKRNQ
jgi:hypothetical protein